MKNTATRVGAFVVLASVLSACFGSSGGLLNPITLFGPTMQAAFGSAPNGTQLTSTQIAKLASENPVSLTADPIDL